MAILSEDSILGLLKRNHPDIDFLEDRETCLNRYRNKNIILFWYSNINAESRVIKYYSLQYLHESVKSKEITEIVKEHELVSRFGDHPNIIRMFGYDRVFHEKELVGIIMEMEKFPMTLKELINRKGKFPYHIVRSFLIQMGDILEVAHYKLEKCIIHSDIKPANIGVRINDDGSFMFVLMDFDVSVELSRPEKTDDEFSTITNKANLKGLTLTYAAPEQLVAFHNKNGFITNRIDVYSVGVIALEMLTGLKPRRQSNSVFYTLPTERLRKDQMDVFTLICNPDPRKRPRTIRSEIFLNRKKTVKPAFVFSIIGIISIIVLISLIITNNNDSSKNQNNNGNDYQTIPGNLQDVKKQDNNNSSEIYRPTDEITVPNVIGMSLHDAINRLNEEGISIGRRISQISSPSYYNKIINTNPPPGKKIRTSTQKIKLIYGTKE